MAPTGAHSTRSGADAKATRDGALSRAPVEGAGNRAIARSFERIDQSGVVQRDLTEDYDEYARLMREDIVLKSLDEADTHHERNKLIVDALKLKARVAGDRHPDARQLLRWVSSFVEKSTPAITPDAAIELPGELRRVQQPSRLFRNNPGWQRGSAAHPIESQLTLVPGDLIRVLPNTYTLSVKRAEQRWDSSTKRWIDDYDYEQRQQDGWTRLKILRLASKTDSDARPSADEEYWLLDDRLHDASEAFASPTWGELDPIDVPLYGEGGPQPDDAIQGLHGDCYLISQLAALAHTDRSLVTNMITELSGGTFVVRFFERHNEEFTPVHVGITRAVVVNSVDYLGSDGVRPMLRGTPLLAGGGTRAPLWPAVIEKAYAAWLGGYPRIDGGNAAAMEHLVGRPAEQVQFDSPLPKSRRVGAGELDAWFETHQMSFDLAAKQYHPEALDLFRVIVDSLENGQLPTLGTPSDQMSEGLAGEHGYTVLGWGKAKGGGKLFLIVRNPWGVSGMAALTPKDLAIPKAKGFRGRSAKKKETPERKKDPTRPTFEIDLRDVVLFMSSLNVLK